MPELRGRITEGSTTNCECLAAWNHKHYRSFPGSPGPLYQNEVKCSAFDMEMIFHSHANKTHFHKKGCALGLILKERVFGTRKWPIFSLDLREYLVDFLLLINLLL